jgi:hypothetical protein
LNYWFYFPPHLVVLLLVVNCSDLRAAPILSSDSDITKSSSFNCSGPNIVNGGYYADLESNCQVIPCSSIRFSECQNSKSYSGISNFQNRIFRNRPVAVKSTDGNNATRQRQCDIPLFSHCRCRVALLIT